jgi:hypothetical protein
MPLSTRHIHPNLPSSSAMPGHAPATSGRGVSSTGVPQGQRSPWLGVVVRFSASCGTCQFVPGFPEMAFQPDKHSASAGHKQGARPDIGCSGATGR